MEFLHFSGVLDWNLALSWESSIATYDPIVPLRSRRVATFAPTVLDTRTSPLSRNNWPFVTTIRAPATWGSAL
ncbi:unnamed protein product [Zymoseptoria tritici ST99CH_3D7]|uniref:Uncharacterized protein n=1 Tax=Zymoseptoria tritici (strain ST99CH_3D7) TaxID=1276538 RepID=A0A1X7S6M4_ZYMT9|nr:unnamed protein product [Zymoseptoria tritici ST99CH_3D7]